SFSPYEGTHSLFFSPFPFFHLALQSHKHHTFAEAHTHHSVSPTSQTCTSFVLFQCFQAHSRRTPHYIFVIFVFGLSCFLPTTTHPILSVLSVITHLILPAANRVVPKVGGLIIFYN
ncbi:hypothetical protein V8G54_035172, partial [Vigna mungo]